MSQEDSLKAKWLDDTPGSILEVELPEDDGQETLDLYRRYQQLGGQAISELEDSLELST